jgi:hypothetical protein
LTTTEAKTPPDTVAEARATYQMGNTLASWSLFTDALLEFQRSARLHPHAQTTYRMAECERGLGHDTRARELLAQALTMEPGLDEGSRADAKAILERLDKHLVTLQLDVSAEGAALQIDGAPPVPERSATASDKASSGLIAGIAPAGSGMLLSTSKVEVRMNAGHHRIVIAKEGFDAVIVERDFEAGSTVRLPIALRRSIQRYAGYSLIGLGSLGLVGALTSAIFTGVKLEESNSLCVETRCLPGGKEAYGQAHDASIAANWLLGTSALVLGGGVIFWATSGARADSPAPTIPSIHVSAGGSHNAAAFSISGSF